MMERFKLNKILEFAKIFLKKPLSKKRVLKKIITNYLKIAFRREIPLRIVDIATDYSCNFACRHCSASMLQRENRDKLSLDDYKKLFDEVDASGAYILCFTGGEPMLDERLLNIIKTADPRRFIISLFTNGSLVDESKSRKLKNAGVDWVLFSLDSMEESEHDDFRESGSFRKVLQGVDIVTDCGMDAGIAVTVGHHNLRTPGLTSLIKWAENRHLPVFIVLAVQAGRWRENDSISLRGDDIDYINREIFDKYKNTSMDHRSNYFKKGCSTGHERFYLTPYGDVMPCALIQISFGNIRKESVSLIRKRIVSSGCFGYWPGCVAALNAEFRDKYLSKTFRRDTLPIDLEEAGLGGRS